MAKTDVINITAFLLVLAVSCTRDIPQTRITKNSMLTEQQIASLNSKKIFFGHKSVGNNILDGIRDLAASDPRLKLNIVRSAEPQSISGPALAEFEIGENGNPKSKIDEFETILDKGYGAQGGIALFKFCYVDIDSSTDIPRLFAQYRDSVATLKSKYPAWKPVHVTVPLTRVEPSAKAWVKQLLGRTTAQEINIKRNQFNTLIREAYGRADPIFDLAEIESTHADGSRSFFTRGGERVYSLATEYAADSGHLNREGSRVVAQKFLAVIAEL
jgi:hypothetical protein